jgi:hypothetical protein
MRSVRYAEGLGNGQSAIDRTRRNAGKREIMRSPFRLRWRNYNQKKRTDLSAENTIQVNKKQK